MLAAVTIAGGQHPRAMAGWTCPREDECRFVVPVDDPEAAARGYTGVVMRNAPLASSAYKLGFHAGGTRECFPPSNCSPLHRPPTHHPPPPGGRMCMPCWNHISRETRVGDPAAQADGQNKKRALVEPKSQADACRSAPHHHQPPTPPTPDTPPPHLCPPPPLSPPTFHPWAPPHTTPPRRQSVPRRRRGRPKETVLSPSFSSRSRHVQRTRRHGDR